MTYGAILLASDELPTCTLSQTIKYIEKRPHGEYTDNDVEHILATYFAYTHQVDMDAGIVVAQMFLETSNLTSWWAARPRRNPCGYGVTGEQRILPPPDTSWQQRYTDLWIRGYAFDSWDTAIKTHVAHLLCYALKDEDMTPYQREFSDYSPRKNLLPKAFRGCARTVFDLSGKWTSNMKYGQSIISVLGALKIQ